LGLALLERGGVAAWTRAWREAAPARQRPPSRAGPGEPPPARRELVGALASLAVARVAAGG
jgi:hypothetical protein